MPVDKELAKKDPDELTPEEAERLAISNSLVSLDDYNPADVADDEKVVEDVNGRSIVAKDLAAEEDKDQEAAAKDAATKPEPPLSSQTRDKSK